MFVGERHYPLWHGNGPLECTTPHLRGGEAQERCSSLSSPDSDYDHLLLHNHTHQLILHTAPAILQIPAKLRVAHIV